MTETKRDKRERPHVCGLTGFNPMIDPPCEGCIDRAEGRAVTSDHPERLLAERRNEAMPVAAEELERLRTSADLLASRLRECLLLLEYRQQTYTSEMVVSESRVALSQYDAARKSGR